MKLSGAYWDFCISWNTLYVCASPLHFLEFIRKCVICLHLNLGHSWKPHIFIKPCLTNPLCICLRYPDRLHIIGCFSICIHWLFIWQCSIKSSPPPYNKTKTAVQRPTRLGPWGPMGLQGPTDIQAGPQNQVVTSAVPPDITIASNRHFFGRCHILLNLQTSTRPGFLMQQNLNWFSECIILFWDAPGVVYIESVVFYSSLHIHHQIVHTSHFPIFSRPQPGGGVYPWGPNCSDKAKQTKSKRPTHPGPGACSLRISWHTLSVQGSPWHFLDFVKNTWLVCIQILEVLDNLTSLLRHD